MVAVIFATVALLLSSAVASVDPDIAQLHHASVGENQQPVNNQINPVLQKLPDDVKLHITKMALRENARVQAIHARRSRRKELKKESKYSVEGKQGAHIWNRHNQRQEVMNRDNPSNFHAFHALPLGLGDTLRTQFARMDLKSFNKNNRNYQRK